MSLDKITVAWDADLAPIEAKLAQLEGTFKGVSDTGKKSANTVEKEFEKTGKSVSTLGNKLGDLAKKLPGAAIVEEIKSFGQAFDGVAGGTDKATKSMNFLRVAMLSVPVLAVVAAFTALVAYFKRTEEGSEKLERALAAVGAVFDVIVGKAAQLGKLIVDAVSSPKETIKAFGEFIKQNLINRFTAFGVILKAITERDFKGFSNGVIQAATGVADASGKVDRFGKGIKNLAGEFKGAAASALDYTKKLQDIEDEEKNLQLEVTKSVNKRRELAILAKRAGEESKEGIAIIREAVLIEKESVDKQIKLQERKVVELKKLNNKAIAEGRIDKENELDEYREAQIKLENLKGDSLEVIARLENKAASLSQKDQKAANKAKLDEEKKHFKDVVEANNETLGNQINIEAKKDKIVTDYFSKSNKFESILTKNQKNEMLQRVKDFEAAEDAKSKKQKEEDDKRKQIIMAGTQFLQNLSGQYFSFINDKNKTKADTEISEIQRSEESAIASLERKKESGIISERQFDSQKAQIEKRAAEREAVIKTKQAKQEKDNALFQIFINTAAAVIKTFAQLGFVGGALPAAAVAAEGALEAAFVAAKPIPKFNKGTKSVPGVDTGKDSVLAMLRPKEAVIPVDKNVKYSDEVGAMIDGNYDSIIYAKRIKPAVEKALARERKEQNLFANNIYNALKLHGGLDDQNIVRQLKRNGSVELKNASQIGKEIAKNIDSSLHNQYRA